MQAGKIFTGLFAFCTILLTFNIAAMKKEYLLSMIVALIINVLAPVFAGDLKITRATVYLDGAEIRSQAQITLTAGQNTVAFKGLSPYIDPATVQIAGENFRVLSFSRGIETVKDDQAYQDSLGQLQQQIRALESQKRQLTTRISILNKEEQVLMANQKLTGEGQQQAADLRNKLEYFFSRIRETEQARLEVNEKLQQVQKDIDSLKEKIQKLVKPEEKTFSTLTFLLQADRPMQVPVEVRYWVNNTGWFPSYDIFASENSLELTYNANIRQQTGNDWLATQLTVSSASPRKNQQVPGLFPYYLNFDVRPYRSTMAMDHLAKASEMGIYAVSGRVVDASDNFPLPGVSVVVQGTTIGTVTDMDGNYSLQLPSEARVLVYNFIGMIPEERAIDRSVINVALSPDFVALEEIVVTGYGATESKDMRVRGMQEPAFSRPAAPPSVTLGYQTSFAWELETAYDIPSSPEPFLVEVNRQTVPAIMRYKAVPKVDESAFLLAYVPDWERLNLMDGQANLYIDNQFMGRSVLETRFMSDTLSLSLGRDEGIVIKRERQRDYEQRRFWTNRVREERMFMIAVRNTRETPIAIDISDQIPVSQTSDIKVEAIEISGARLDKETGRLDWKLDIAPGQTRELIIHYSVEYPRGRQINLE